MVRTISKKLSPLFALLLVAVAIGTHAVGVYSGRTKLGHQARAEAPRSSASAVRDNHDQSAQRIAVNMREKRMAQGQSQNWYQGATLAS